MDDSLRAFIAALPKAELHVHLEGSMAPEVSLELASRRGVALPGAPGGVRGLRRAFVFTTFDDFLRLYVALSRCLQHAEDFRDITVDLADRLAAQNVRYAEVTVTPWTHVHRGVEPDTLHAGLLEGRAAARERGVELRFVFDVVRACADQADPTVDFALAHRRRDPDGVVGIGVGGPEAGTFDMDTIAAAFARGRAQGLHAVPHAGEMAGAPSIWTAVRDLGAVRIGHGVRCLEDPRLVEHLVAEGIALEVCPTSNVALGVVPELAAHPLPTLLDAGLRVSLGSDDPPLFGTDLLTEYVRCAEAFSWGEADVRAIAAAAVRDSFMDDEAKAALRREQDAVALAPPESPDLSTG